MKIVYIAHPIKGDVENNLQRIRCIVRELNLQNKKVLPFAPYWLDCHALDDSIGFERQRGIRNNIELFNRKFIDEVWLYGDRISAGMEAEVKLAISLNIPVYCKSKGTIADGVRLIDKIFI